MCCNTSFKSLVIRGRRFTYVFTSTVFKIDLIDMNSPDHCRNWKTFSSILSLKVYLKFLNTYEIRRAPFSAFWSCQMKWNIFKTRGLDQIVYVLRLHSCSLKWEVYWHNCVVAMTTSPFLPRSRLSWRFNAFFVNATLAANKLV